MWGSKIGLMTLNGPKISTKNTITTLTTTTTTTTTMTMTMTTRYLRNFANNTTLIHTNYGRKNLMSTAAAGQPEIVTTVVAGRSRKRLRVRRRNENNTGNNTEKTTPQFSSSSQSTIDNTIESLPYPNGRPWRVLWPRPHGEPPDSSSSTSKRKRIPRIKDFRRAWKLYKETWEDGLSGIPSKKTNNNITNTTGTSMSMSNSLSSLLSSTSTSLTLTSPTPTEELQNIGDNAAKNLRSVRQNAQELLEQAKENTGIRNQEDMKELASEMMTIATECIKEFMAGYRKGRDTEIDKMLHEYFQDNEEEEEEKKDSENSVKKNNITNPKLSEEDAINTTNDQITKTRRRKRKPKRGIPRE
jgi:hypothetical protein